MSYLNYKDDPRSVLIHFNPNHDPNNGQFTNEKGGYGSSETVSSPSNRNLKDGLRNSRMRDAHGAELNTPKSKLTDEQKEKLKKATIAAVAAVGVCAGIYIAYRTHATEKIKNLIKFLLN